MHSDGLLGGSGHPWQLQTAKARFSELFRLVRSSGPQWITRQGKEAVVLISAEDFARLSARTQEECSMSKFFAQSPLAESGVMLTRDPDTGRDITL